MNLDGKQTKTSDSCLSENWNMDRSEFFAELKKAPAKHADIIRQLKASQ